MSDTPDRLYNLLPMVYRMRDAERGEPLRALLQVIGEQVGIIEEDIARLYENWFIETCEEWAVPYIADLIGYRLPSEAGAPGAVDTPAGQRRNALLIGRREVANTIAYRRRKGALALLELLGQDVGAWPTRAVEFYRLLAVTQQLSHLRTERGRTLDLRDGDALERIDGPFDGAAHTYDVRRIRSSRSAGRYAIPHVGLFVWRLKAYSIGRQPRDDGPDRQIPAPAYCIDRVRYLYTFSVLGNNAPLFTRPVDEPGPAHIADELNVPGPIRRRALELRLADYYGPGKSLAVYVTSAGQRQLIPIERIVAADLSGWAYQPQGDLVAIDPLLGRLALGPQVAAREGVWVQYHYGFSDDIGGGEYRRALRSLDGFVPATEATAARAEGDEAPARLYFGVGLTGAFRSIGEALERWRALSPDDAVIELLDSDVYVEEIAIALRAGQRLELRAASGCRPVIQPVDIVNRPDALRAECAEEGPPARLTLDGLLVAKRSVQISGNIGQIVIRHCTLVPGWSLGPDCEPESETEPSLELIDVAGPVQIERTITGSIQVTKDEVQTDPLALCVSDSILDATRPDFEALGAPGCPVAHVVATVLRCTVFGRLNVHAIDLAENSIFTGLVKVARRQRGCVRFCHVPHGSRTPRRYSCQPDLAEAALRETDVYGALSPADQEAALAQARRRVWPQFSSQRYGTPTYARLGVFCPPEIARGADDESEMGAFHDLYQPQRAANLLARAEEYAPASAEAGAIWVTG